MRTDEAYFLWWDITSTSWNISEVLGTQGALYWQHIDPSITGLYSPQGTATGDATVALGEHP